MIKDSYSFTEEEKEKVIKSYFKKEGEIEKLTTIPSKEKRKLIVLEHIMQSFEVDKKYTHQEVNQMLEEIHPDYSTIRRHLVDYGFMERTKDCQLYWVKK